MLWDTMVLNSGLPPRPSFSAYCEKSCSRDGFSTGYTLAFHEALTCSKPCAHFRHCTLYMQHLDKPHEKVACDLFQEDDVGLHAADVELVHGTLHLLYGVGECVGLADDLRHHGYLSIRV